MQAIWNNEVVAESDDTVVVDGNHYFPRESLNDEYLVESNHTTACCWKGTAQYYSLKVGDQTNENAVWYYATPKDGAKEIAGRVAFWNGVKVAE